MNLDELIARFSGRRKGAYAMFRCQAHDDKQASLSASEANGRLLLKCHAGCDTQAILDAWGLTWADVSPAREHAKAGPETRTTYRYTLPDGTVLEHIRIEVDRVKRYIWATNGKSGLFGFKLDGCPLWVPQGSQDATGPAIICEGEKAADAAAALGLQAYGTATGASSAPSVDILGQFRGQDVVIWPDHDEPGRKHAALIATRLEGIASSVRLIAWGEQQGDDAADFLARGGTPEGAAALVKAAKPAHADPLVMVADAVRPALEELDRLHIGDFSRWIETGIPSLDKKLGGGLRFGEVTLIGAPTGAGKCLGLGTPVMKRSGEIVPVESIVSGDVLMGPDSGPRRVLSVATGRGALYRIQPRKGKPWVCNGAHVLTLIHTQSGETVDVPLERWMLWSKNQKHLHKLFTAAVEFEPHDLPTPVDPYLLGVWFGDGTKATSTLGLRGVGVTKRDPEIGALMCSEAKRRGLHVNSYTNGGRAATHQVHDVRGGTNTLLEDIRSLIGPGLDVPAQYLATSRAARLDFLAGWLDTDGHHTHGGYDFVQKRRDYADSVAFLARSVGLRASVGPKEVKGYGTYWRVSIHGDCTMIPMRLARKKAALRKINKDCKRTGFSVRAIGVGDYYGFELDGDGRFLLGDFTVTHNTTLVVQFAMKAQEKGLAVVVSPEMSARSLTEREIVRRSGYPKHDRSPWAPPEKRERAASAHAIAAGELLTHPPRVAIYDSMTVTLDEAHAAIKARAKREKVVLVALDYAQQLADMTDERRYLAVGNVAHRAIEMAREFDCHVLVTSQVNTIAEGKGKRYSFRESAVLEQKANNGLLFIVEWDAESRRILSARFETTKIRDGAQFRLNVEYDARTFQVNDEHTQDMTKVADMRDWTR